MSSSSRGGLSATLTLTSGAIWASALFVAADSIGPLYLAFGYAEGGNYAVYLFLGARR
jgi:hypothetical protein